MTKREQAFIEIVWAFYCAHGRHNLPWRKTKNPYRILVSEIMLQQTQVERVIPKYQAFLKEFPNITALAEAPLRAVLIAWQGLGYNRRAKLLHECARTIVENFQGKFPKTHHELMKLPGVGHYTAGALGAFAFGHAEPIIETNIRSVYVHHFFKHKTAVPDADIVRLVARTLPVDNPRAWYYALMDYGVHIKKTFGNPNHRSAHYTTQSRFKGSDREIRGALVRELTTGTRTLGALKQTIPQSPERIAKQLTRLIGEGIVVKNGRQYSLPNQ